ncbi:MAG: TfoX/Sxy family protein [Thermomicrobiales bacterium]
MSEPERGPADAFAAMIAAIGDQPGVTPPDPTGAGKRFGADALKVNDKIFAMLVGDRLVVKLPRQRVDDLIARGHGERFASGQGRPMKEWFSVGPSAMPDSLDLAREALAFVASGR